MLKGESFKQRCHRPKLVLKQGAFFRAFRHLWSSWFSNTTAIYNKITFKVSFCLASSFFAGSGLLSSFHTLCSSVFPSLLPSPPFTPHSHYLPSTLPPPCSCQSARVAGQTHIYPQRVTQSGRCLLTVWSSLLHTGDRRQVFLEGVGPRLQVWLGRHRGWSSN